jgi:hypothetical protein
MPLPTLPEIDAYMTDLDARSKAIGGFVKEEYTAFYNQLDNAFKSVAFLSVSALGSQPDGLKLTKYQPTNVVDPLLWRLRMEGLL